MANPITWQNIGQASFGDAANFLQMSQQGANQALASAKGKFDEQLKQTKAVNTNKLLAKIGSINDEATLAAFADTVDLEDPTIDSNVMVKALGQQRNNILDRDSTLLGMDATKQNIAASKAGVNLNERQFAETLDQNDFNNNLKSQEFAAEQTTRKINNAGGLLRNEALEGEINDAQALRNVEVATGNAVRSVFEGKVPLSEAYASVVSAAAANGKISVAGKQLADMNQSVFATLGANPAQLADVDRADKKYLQAIASIESAKEIAQKKLDMEKYNGSPPKLPPSLTQQIEQGATNGTVVDEFVKGQDEGINDTWTFGLNVNDLKKEVSTKDSELYKSFINKLKDSKGNLPPEYSNAEIDPQLLKAALSGVTNKGQFSNGVSRDDIASNLAELFKSRKTYEQYQKDYAKDVGIFDKKIKELTIQRGSDLEAFQAKILKSNTKAVATALGAKDPDSVNIDERVFSNQVSTNLGQRNVPADFQQNQQYE